MTPDNQPAPQDPTTAPAQPADTGTTRQPDAPAQTPVSDDQTPRDGSGTHGRPSDDSDPGHS